MLYHGAMIIHDLAEAEHVLATYRPAVKEFLGKGITLDRMTPLMDALGNPQDNLRIIHVAGTSGKTSTSYYIAKMLQLTGSKVGLTTSPHVNSLLERIQVNGQEITESEFCEQLQLFIEKIEGIRPRPTYYELLIAFAYYYFHKIKVDFAVIETGLGGTHDCTNVAKNPEKLCVVTDIGIDHTKVLGSTIPKIAAQKAGIIHKGNHCIMFEQSQEVMSVFEDRCDAVEAVLDAVNPILINDFVFKPTMPLYQRRNWTLAWSAYQRLANVYNLPVLQGELIEGSRSVQIPGRMEIIGRNGTTLVLDGAHNEQKMKAFVDSFAKLYPGMKPDVLLSVRDRKDFTDLVKLLFPLANKLILTSFHVSQDIDHRNAHLEDIKQFCLDSGYHNVIVQADQRLAFSQLLAGNGDPKIITGSFYLIQQLKQQEQL